MRLLGKALTFDDVLLVPAYSQVLPRDTSLATRLSRNIALNLPLVSAAMDTVTEARLAIAIAQEGGIGIVHKNLTPKQQAAEVARVKRYESGLLRDPITVTPQTTVREVMALSRQHGFSGFPVLEALAAGTPAIAADIPALREAGGDAAVYLDPDDADGWSQTIERLATQPDERTAIAERGHAHAAGFTWERTAEATIDAWREVLRRG